MFTLRRPRIQPPTLPAPPVRPCDELGTIAEPFSPMIAEMLALFCHTRPLKALTQVEQCPQEYQLLARQIIQQLLNGWVAQSGGRGSIDDLIARPTPAPPPDMTASR